MTVLTFEQILNGESLVRSGVVEIPSVGDLHLFELSDEEFSETQKDISDKTETQLQAHLKKWAIRLMKGSMPSAKDTKAFANKFSSRQWSDIYHCGLTFSPKLEDKEEIEKN